MSIGRYGLAIKFHIFNNTPHPSFMQLVQFSVTMRAPRVAWRAIIACGAIITPRASPVQGEVASGARRSGCYNVLLQLK